MPRTKKQPQPVVPPPMATNGPASEVLTLAEAAAYLRLPEAEVVRLVSVLCLTRPHRSRPSEGA